MEPIELPHPSMISSADHGRYFCRMVAAAALAKFGDPESAAALAWRIERVQHAASNCAGDDATATLNDTADALRHVLAAHAEVSPDVALAKLRAFYEASDEPMCEPELSLLNGTLRTLEQLVV